MQTLIDEINNLRVNLKIRIDDIMKIDQQLYGGNFVTQLGKMEILIGYAKTCATNSIILPKEIGGTKIPDRQLVLDIANDVRDVFKNISEIIDIINHNLNSLQNGVIDISTEINKLKQNEFKYTEYIKKLETEIAYLKQNQELISQRDNYGSS